MKRPWSLRAAAVVAGVLVLTPTGVASAHPFGDPQQAEVSATATGLRIEWHASPDDLAVLAGWIGATDGSGSIMVYEDGEFAPEESSELPGTQLARAPQLEDYFLERVEVAAGDTSCTGDLRGVEDVESEGVTIDFDCGGPVGSAEVRIATLTDVDENYRTLATGPQGQRHAYAADTGSLTWTFPVDGAPAPAAESSASSGRSAAYQLGGAGLGAALLAGLGLAIRQGQRSRRAGGA